MAVRNVKRSYGGSAANFQANVFAVLAQVLNFKSYLTRDIVSYGSPTLVQGTSDAAKVRISTPFRAFVGGQEIVVPIQEVAITGTVTAAGNKWGAWRLVVAVTGTVTAQRIAATMAEASETAALQLLGSIAKTASSTTIGLLTVQGKNGGADFTAGTTALVAGADCTAVGYYNLLGARGVVSAATLTVGAATEKFARGAVTVQRYGARLAAIAVNAASTFTAADTITTAKWGGWLLCTDLAGTAVISIKPTGVAAAALMAYDTRALCDTALDTYEANLPECYVCVGRVVVKSAVAPWTANTDDLAGTDSVEAWFTPKADGAYSTSATDKVGTPVIDSLNLV